MRPYRPDYYPDDWVKYRPHWRRKGTRSWKRSRRHQWKVSKARARSAVHLSMHGAHDFETVTDPRTGAVYWRVAGTDTGWHASPIAARKAARRAK